jgi:2-oxoglutarate dehydrogenase E2 component (dihydrolipoamide succinyltransferase)
MAALIDVRVPGEQSEGTRSQVLRWLKGVGDRVAVNEPLLELETDKVTVEIASPAAGVLREILKQAPQDVVPEEIVARLETPEAGTTVGEAISRAKGTGANGVETAARRIDDGPSSADEAEAGCTERPKLSPSVRRLLAEKQIDATRISGSGKGGRITADDVLRYAAARGTANAGRSAALNASTTAATSSAAPAAPAAPAARAAAVAGTGAADVERVPHSAMRRRIAERMVESLLHTAPHVTTVFEADLGAVLAHRELHKAEFARSGTPLTLTAYFALACVDAIRAVPEANSRWTDDAQEIHRNVDVGIATALEDRGLVVPVLRGVESLNLYGVAQQLADLTTRAREDRLTPADVRGGTFTISNHGVSGSLVATPIIINQPQSAILGIGKLEKRVVVVEGPHGDSIVIRPRCYVSLTIDHRAMDGHRANRFLRTFVERLESWR